MSEFDIAEPIDIDCMIYEQHPEIYHAYYDFKAAEQSHDVICKSYVSMFFSEWAHQTATRLLHEQEAHYDRLTSIRE